MSRLLSIISSAIWSVSCGLITLLVLGIGSLNAIDWNRFTPQLAAYAADAIGGEVTVAEIADIRWGRTAEVALRQVGVHVPGPDETFTRVNVDQLRLVFDLRAAYHGALVIHELDIGGVELSAQIADSGGTTNADPASSLFSRVQISNARIGLRSVEISDLSDGTSYSVSSAEVLLDATAQGDTPTELLDSASGKFSLTAEEIREISNDPVTLETGAAEIAFGPKGEPAKGDLSVMLTTSGLPARTPLKYSGQLTRPLDVGALSRLELRGKLEIGDIPLQIDGVFTDVTKFRDGNFAVSATAQNSATLAKLVERKQPFGSVVASARLHMSHKRYELREFDLELDNVAAAGQLVWAVQPGPDKLSGELSLPTLDLRRTATEQLRAETAALEAGRVIPKTNIRINPLGAIEVDLGLKVRGIAFHEDTDIAGVEGRLSYSDGVLSFDDARAQVNGGTIVASGELQVDAKPQRVRMRSRGTGIAVDSYFAKLTRMDLGSTRLAFESELAGEGDTLRALLANVSGKLDIEATGGEFKARAVERLVIGSARLFGAVLEDRDVTAIHCVGAHWQVVDGIGTTDSVLLDTDDFTLAGSGTVNLGTERLDMGMILYPRRRALLSSTTVFELQGTLASQEVNVPKRAALKAAINAVGIATTPLSAIAAIRETPPTEPGSCLRAIDRARNGEVADPSLELEISGDGVLEETGEVIVDTLPGAAGTVVEGAAGATRGVVKGAAGRAKGIVGGVVEGAGKLIPLP